MRPDDTVLLIPELSDHLPSYTWGAEARLAIRAASIGYGLAATIHADALDEVFDALRRPRSGSTTTSCPGSAWSSSCAGSMTDRRRVVAAHYIRPTARDGHGHVQRLGPAVLATWDASTDTFEHFGWGITPELAVRLGVHAGDLEHDIDRRRAYLAGLAAADLTDVDEVRRAIDGFRATGAAASATGPATN